MRRSSSAMSTRVKAPGPSSSAGPSSGTTIVNRAPAPGELESSTRPWCASAIAFTMARPSPAPSQRRASGLRLKRSNMASCS